VTASSASAALRYRRRSPQRKVAITVGVHVVMNSDPHDEGDETFVGHAWFCVIRNVRCLPFIIGAGGG